MILITFLVRNTMGLKLSLCPTRSSSCRAGTHACIPLPSGLRPGPHGCFALLFHFPCASASMSGPFPVPTYASTLHSTWLFCLVAFVFLVLLLQYTGTQVGSLPMNAAFLPFGVAVYAHAHGWHPCFRVSAARRSFLRYASISTLGVYAYLLPFGVVHLLTRMAGTPVLGYHVFVYSCSLWASAAGS